MEQNNRPLGWTSLEEAKQLIEAGLSVETADMYYWLSEGKEYVYTGKCSDSNGIPCWSLGTLSELIPKIHESEDDGGCYPTLCKRYDTDKWHCLYHRDTLYKTRQYDIAIEAVIEMVIWLLKYELI